MVNLVCPLCGRHVVREYFDPSKFARDIYAVEVTGLGRGRGFAVSEPFSVLDDPEIIGPIAERCRVILELTEGKALPTIKEVSALKAEIVSIEKHLRYWMNETLVLRRARKKDEAEMGGMEDEISFWRNETLRLGRARKKDEAELGGMEDEVSYWRLLVKGLRDEVAQLKDTVGELEEKENEGELLAMEEMDEILERINESTNEDFELLSEAVEYLLEGE